MERTDSGQRLFPNASRILLPTIIQARDWSGVTLNDATRQSAPRTGRGAIEYLDNCNSRKVV